MGGRRILWLWLGEELWAPVFTREEEGVRDSLVVGLAYSPKNMVGYFLEKNKILLAGSCLSCPLRSVNLWFPWSCWAGSVWLYGVES